MVGHKTARTVKIYLSPFSPSVHLISIIAIMNQNNDMETVQMIEWIRQAQQGDADAYGKLIGIYQDCFYRVARSRLHNDEDAADAIQEMLLTGWEKCSTLKEPKYFKTWMIRILINKCNNILRKNRPLESLDHIPEPCAENMEDNIMFQAMIQELSEKNRIVMALYYGDSYTIREISQILEISEDAVKNRLSRGRKEVLKFL